MMMHPNCILCSHITDVNEKVLRTGGNDPTTLGGGEERGQSKCQ